MVNYYALMQRDGQKYIIIIAQRNESVMIFAKCNFS